MVSNQEFLAAVRKNAARVNNYESGGDGTGGGCDCIGLIIGALRLCGESWNGTHGSNWAARNAMRHLARADDAAELAPGDIVYKAREPGETGYALPEKYAASADQKDYYHVGVVTGVEPLEITHCTSVPGGIQRDSRQGKWLYAGRLKVVELSAEETEEAPMEGNYRVTGGSLRMRKSPGKSSAVLLSIPDGSAVTASDSGTAGWMEVVYNGKTGYCMAQYLSPLGEAEDMDALLAQIEALAARARRLIQ